MDKDILKGIKISFGFVLFLLAISSLSYAGYHGANNIVSGTFLGNYLFQNNVTFSNDVNFTDANIIGLSVGGFPSGFVGTFSTSTCPSGWLEANGSSISRATYLDLFTAINTMYGVGDGSTTFEIPDYRGYFLRSWDNTAGNDPDAASRTDRGDGTTGDNIGTIQSYQIQSHAHTEYYLTGGNGAVAGSGDLTAHLRSTSATGGAETRPKNINVLYCIKE